MREGHAEAELELLLVVVDRARRKAAISRDHVSDFTMHKRRTVVDFTLC